MIYFLVAQLAHAQTNLMVNGDFSKNPCPNDWCLSSDQSQISPWTITSPQQTYEIDPPKTFGLPSYAMDLNSDGDNAMVMIQQVIPTTLGASYEVSFSLSQNPHCGGVGLKTGFVMASGGASQMFSTSDLNTQRITYQFVAATAQSAVTIGSTTAGTTCGPVVFNIGMTQLGGYIAPPPSTTTPCTTTAQAAPALPTTTPCTTTMAYQAAAPALPTEPVYQAAPAPAPAPYQAAPAPAPYQAAPAPAPYQAAPAPAPAPYQAAPDAAPAPAPYQAAPEAAPPVAPVPTPCDEEAPVATQPVDVAPVANPYVDAPTGPSIDVAPTGENPYSPDATSEYLPFASSPVYSSAEKIVSMTGLLSLLILI